MNSTPVSPASAFASACDSDGFGPLIKTPAGKLPPATAPHPAVGFISALLKANSRNLQKLHDSASPAADVRNMGLPVNLNFLTSSTKSGSLSENMCRADTTPCRTARSLCAARIFCSKESASSLAPLARLNALDAAVCAFTASVSALPRDFSAVPALVNAPSADSLAASAMVFAVLDSSWAVLADLAASPASCSTYAIICPDNCDVRTAVSISPAIPKISTIKESRATLLAQSLLLGIDVNSAMNSPTQPIKTTPVQMYPAISQHPNDDFNNATSDAVKVILAHQKRAEKTLIAALVGVHPPAGSGGFEIRSGFKFRGVVGHSQRCPRNEPSCGCDLVRSCRTSARCGTPCPYTLQPCCD